MYVCVCLGVGVGKVSLYSYLMSKDKYKNLISKRSGSNQTECQNGDY